MTLTVSISHHLYLPCRFQYTIRIINTFSCIFICMCMHTCMVYAFVCTRCIDVGANVSSRVFVCGVVYKNKNKYKYEMSLWHSAKRISFDPLMHSSTHKQEISISHLSTLSHTYTDTRTDAVLSINLHNNKFLNSSPYHIIYYIHIYTSISMYIYVCHGENNITWREEKVSTERTYSCAACT
jgi:hypothetical protein